MIRFHHPKYCFLILILSSYISFSTPSQCVCFNLPLRPKGGCNVSPAQPFFSLTALQSFLPNLEREELECSFDRRIIAIGDVHGDLSSFQRCMRIGGLIDGKNQWCGKDAVVVQIGDIFDRGDEDLEILQAIHRLDAQAKTDGGSVISLIGNHEVMSVMGNHRYITQKSCVPFNRLKEDIDEWLGGDWSDFNHLPEHERCRAAALSPGGMFSNVLSKHPIALKVGSTVFCHGGLTSNHLTQQSIAEMNRECEQWILGHGPFPACLMGADSPVWNRDFSLPESYDLPTLEVREELEQTLNLVGAERMVVGHTPQRVGINSACEGKVWRIDAGVSAFYGGLPQVLEIYGDQISVLTEYQRIPGDRRASKSKSLSQAVVRIQ